MYLEDRVAIKHRQNEIARIYVWILESGSIQGKTHKVAPVITCSEAADERSKQRFTADWCQMHQLGGCMLARQEHTKFADRAARSSEREEC